MARIASAFPRYSSEAGFRRDLRRLIASGEFARGVSPPAGGEPALDVIEAIGAPERLAVDDEERRAEDLARDRGIDHVLQLVLHRLVVDCGKRLRAIESVR